VYIYKANSVNNQFYFLTILKNAALSTQILACQLTERQPINVFFCNIYNLVLVSFVQKGLPI
jgi:hypothetical protein